MTRQHAHAVQHWPLISAGWGVCTCGATIRVEGGRSVGEWHTCALCVSTPEATP